jgi:hypothetical protein
MMMKTLFSGFAAFLLAFSAFSASAKTVSVDMSEYTSGEGWKQLSSALVADGFMKTGETVFSTEGISYAMYNVLSAPQQAAMSRAAFHRLNIVVNNLPERISIDQFRRIAGNLKVPDVVEAARAAPAISTSTPAATTAAPLPTVTAENLGRQLGEFKKLTTGRFADLDKKVDDLQKAFDSAGLKSQMTGLVTSAQAIRNELNRLNARVEQVEIDLTAVRGEINVLKGTLANPENGLAAISAKTETAMNMVKTVSDEVGGLNKQFGTIWMAMAAVGVLSLLAIVIGIVALWRRGPAATKTTSADKQGTVDLMDYRNRKAPIDRSNPPTMSDVPIRAVG